MLCARWGIEEKIATATKDMLAMDKNVKVGSRGEITMIYFRDNPIHYHHLWHCCILPEIPENEGPNKESGCSSKDKKCNGSGNDDDEGTCWVCEVWF